MKTYLYRGLSKAYPNSKSKVKGLQIGDMNKHDYGKVTRHQLCEISDKILQLDLNCTWCGGHGWRSLSTNLDKLKILSVFTSSLLTPKLFRLPKRKYSSASCGCPLGYSWWEEGMKIATRGPPEKEYL